jgi:hypothetical protein
MPTGSFTYDPQAGQLVMDAIAVRTYLYSAPDDDDDEEENPYTLLPNVRCEQIQYREGSEVPTARFSYVLDDIANATNGWPNQFEQIWPIYLPPSNYVLQLDDEIVVLGHMPDGTTRVLFHGFARVPQTDISPDHQAVTFVAVGVAIRSWDIPIAGSWWRNADEPWTGDDDNQVATDLPCRFNPSEIGTHAIGGYLPNCTPDNSDCDFNGDNPHPVFLEPCLDSLYKDGSATSGAAPGDPAMGGRSEEETPQTFWDLDKAVRYILGNHNVAEDANGDLWVDNPDFHELQVLLQNRQPKPPFFYDPNDLNTYTTDENRLRDYDASNKPWPTVVEQLLEFYGYGMRWVCEDDDDGLPDDYLDIYRKDASAPNAPKSVYLPTTGSSLADAMANVASMHAAYDFHSVFNAVCIESATKRYEISVLLAPGFKIKQSDDGSQRDNAPANVTMYKLSALNANDAKPEQRKKYRYFIADECADGHWSIANKEWITDEPFDFTDVFMWDTSKGTQQMIDQQEGDEDEEPEDETALFVKRYRPGKHRIFSKDSQNLPRKAQLAVSRNYNARGNAPEPPCLWDGETGTDWQEITGGWELLKDRLGIMVTVEDPENWQVGKPKPGYVPPLPPPPPPNFVGPPPPPPPPPPQVPYPCADGVLKGVTCWANPRSVNPNSGKVDPESQVYLRLTTVIEADFGIGDQSLAQRRPASAIAHPIYRVIDCRDHFKYDVIDASSPFFIKPKDESNQDWSMERQVVQDDIEQAKTHAAQVRSAHEFPPLTAAITIPYCSMAYHVGDRISDINGRDVSLIVNAGDEQQEAPSYPFIVALTWDFTGEKQSTILQLSDRRTEPRLRNVRHGGRGH